MAYEWRSRLAILAAVGLAAVGLRLVACSRVPSPGQRVEVAARLIAEDPSAVLSKASLFKVRRVFTWRFDSPADLEAWDLEQVEEARLVPRGLALTSADGDLRLSRTVALEADSIHAVKVATRGSRLRAAELSWAAPGDSFSEERRIAFDAGDEPARDVPVTFEVATHPLWSGAIDRLRLDLKTRPGVAVNLASVTGVERVTRAKKLAAALARSWKVDLGSEVRSAWLATPGTATERQVEVGREQRLDFAYGLEEGVRDPVSFVIEVEVDGGARETLFRQRLDTGQAGHWHEGSLDLAPLADREARLRFTTESAGILELVRGFPVWAHPEILGPASGEEEPPNVLLLSIDTLRADHLSAYGYGRQTSPAIDDWARRSAVVFENAVAQAPWTLPSHVSLFTGQEAIRHGINHYGSAPPSLEMLAEILRRQGYATGAVTGGGYLRPQFGFAQGFDRFRYWPKILADEELEQGTDQALSWLTAHRDRPFFLFFHTYEVHFPHRRREPYFSKLADWESLRQPLTRIQMRPNDPSDDLTWAGDRFVVRRPGSKEWAEGLSDAEKNLAASMYDSAIAYTDTQVARLFARLEELSLTDNTLVILTSDHGEALGEDGRAGHNYLAEHNLMVPLIVGFPDGRGAGRRVESQVRSIDVLPTILDYLGLGASSRSDGRSLLPLVEGGDGDWPAEAWSYASSANYGLALRYRNRLKYVFNNTAWSTLLGGEELYDLGADPAESQNLAATKEEAAAFRRQLRAYVDAHHEGLRLEIANPGPGRLSGRLTGAWAKPSKVKTADPECSCLDWETGEGATFSLAEGQRTTLYFEGLSARQVGLEGSGGQPRAAFAESFEWTAADGVQGLVYSGSAWQRRQPADGEAFTGFKIWKVGERRDEVVVPESDPNLTRQLRALGYVR